MSDLQEQAMQMIGRLSDDNIIFLIEFMQRFMMPKKQEILLDQNMETTEAENVNLMQELERMRMKTKSYFPADFHAEKIWEEAMKEKI